MSLTADELRGYVAHGLNGIRRVHVLGVPLKGNTEADRKRARRWKTDKAEEHRAYVREHQKRNRPAANARVERYTKAHPERRKAQLRIAALKRYRKLRAIGNYIALLWAFASSTAKSS